MQFENVRLQTKIQVGCLHNGTNSATHKDGSEGDLVAHRLEGCIRIFWQRIAWDVRVDDAISRGDFDVVGVLLIIVLLLEGADLLEWRLAGANEVVLKRFGGSNWVQMIAFHVAGWVW